MYVPSQIGANLQERIFGCHPSVLIFHLLDREKILVILRLVCLSFLLKSYRDRKERRLQLASYKAGWVSFFEVSSWLNTSLGKSVPELAKHYILVNSMEGHHTLATAELQYYFNWALPTDLHAWFAKDAREHVALTWKQTTYKAGANPRVDAEFCNSSWTSTFGHWTLNICSP